MNIDFNILNKDTIEDFYTDYYKIIKRKLKRFNSNYQSCSEFLGYLGDLTNLINILDNIIEYSEFYKLKINYSKLKKVIYSNKTNVKLIIQNYKKFINDTNEEDKYFIEYLLRIYKSYINEDINKVLNTKTYQSNLYTYDDILLSELNYKKLMRTTESEDKRKEIFMTYNTPNHDKIKLLAETLIIKQKIAEQYQFKNYGDYRLKNLMGHDTTNIQNFLGTMNSYLELQYLTETEELTNMKGSELFAWDIDYYTHKKNNYPKISNINQILSTIFHILGSLWNIEIKKNNKIDNCYDVFRKNKQRGRFYLFPRNQTESWMIQPSCRYPYNSNNIQLNVSIVHYNIQNLKDVQIFFGKMGLIIHNMFGISKYSCFAGPKISDDTIGIMNSLFEKIFIDKCLEITGYSWTPEFGTAIKFMNSLFIASFDNYLHSSNDVINSLLTHGNNEYGQIIYTVFNNLHKIVLNFDINSIPENIINKIINNSCTNYSELWTELYACQIYNKLTKSNNYKYLIKHLLEKGYMMSIKYKKYLEESINPEYFLKYYNIKQQELIEDSDSESNDYNQYLSEVA